MPLISADWLTEFTEAILVAAGSPKPTAECVARSLVGSNIAGHDSHGVMKLPSYIRDIRRQRLNPAATPRIVHRAKAIAVIDGAGGFGHLTARLAADTAIDQAREMGMAAVASSHCHHTGRLGGWSERIAAAGLIGMITGAEANPPYLVAPHQGREGALATNPVTWAIPRAGQDPILLDYATSVVSIGKLQDAEARGEDIPPGWILDAEGRPTDDLNDFISGGVLLPFGGYKGYALGVVAELLAVGLSAGHRVPPGERSSCLCVLALDPAVFGPSAAFQELVERTVARLRAVPPCQGHSDVMVPGDPERKARLIRSADGIPLPDPTWHALTTVADELGVDCTPGLRGERDARV